ncbi:peptidase A24A prepilin type IV [Streptomyces xiamenensis]|uniref:Peptidase A24A prepilin type IV n=1 Tax=Streptomyces xiamenensis TaxID=408015 RepID=A0A0F7CPP5_9ACTN|nr:peptidase A24A prepilin type IV [Streptomyces xiamenensis]
MWPARTLSRVHPLLILAAAAYGALTGPLLARPRYRLSVEPEEPWRSACPAGHPLPPAAQGGWLGTARCPHCPPATRRYGTGAGALTVWTALVCAALAAATGPHPELVVWLLAAPAVVLLAAVDLSVQRLPDPLTLPLAAALPVALGVAALSGSATGSWPRALLGGLVLGAVYFVLFLINPRGMGFGDVKLAVPLGVAMGWYGWDVIFFGTFTGFLCAAGYGLILIVARRATRKTAVPFGPFMALGALVALLLGALAAA